MTKRYSDAEGQIDVMVGITGDLRDLQAQVQELQAHIERITQRLKYPTIIDNATTTTLQKLVVVGVSLAAALAVTAPLAETLIQARKVLEDAQSPQDASEPLRGPWVQGDA